MSEPPGDAHVLVGLLGDEPVARTEEVAARLHVAPDVAERCLAALERDGLVERVDAGAWRPAALDPVELRELYPAVAILESLAVRRSPPFDAAVLAELRAATERLRAAVGDPRAAIDADYDFHERLTAGCGNPGLLRVLASVRRALVRYEHAYMLDPTRIARSAAQHEGIVAALGDGDHALAAERVRENFTSSLPDVAAQFRRP